MSKEVYDIISETGKQLKFNWCPPWIKKAYMAQIHRVTDAVRLMMNNSTSPFMKLFLDAKKAG
jgi:poly(3-hydroxyalkanoate) synthetase